MGFESFLGNERLRENLTGSLRRGHISHFYLICGPVGSGKHTLAQLLAAAILCGRENAPCGHCTACRKVFSGNHPDFNLQQSLQHPILPLGLSHYRFRPLHTLQMFR